MFYIYANSMQDPPEDDLRISKDAGVLVNCM